MRKCIKFRWLAGIVVFIICFACLESFCMETENRLDNRLARIRVKNKGIGTDWAKLEAECLNLVKDHNSPVEKGKIYATIALIYTEKGWSSAEDERIPKALKYCKKALEYPLEVITACRMYGGWADSLMVEYWERPEKEFARTRHEAIVPCLTGLKLALDNKAPKKLPEKPMFVRYNWHVPKDSPEYQEMMRKQEEQMAAYRRWKLQDGLYFQRKALTQRCVSLYSHKPYDIDELKSFADKILKDYDDVVQELLAEVEAEIARIEKRSASNEGAK